MRGICDMSIPCTSWNSVLMTPGRQTWTRTPVSASSLASAWVNVTRNALAPA